MSGNQSAYKPRRPADVGIWEYFFSIATAYGHKQLTRLHS